MILRSDILLLDVGGTFIKCADGRCIPMPSGGSREEIASALQQAVAGWNSPAWCGPELVCGKQKASPLSGNAFRIPVPAPQSPAQCRIGVAIPGPFDYGRGIFLMRHKFAAVYGESFRALAALPEDCDIRFRHDVIAALEGCLVQQDAAGDCGAGPDCGKHSPTGVMLSAFRSPDPGHIKPAAPVPQNTALVTIGTGLGFAHTLDGTVQVGPNGSPAQSIYNLPWGDGILEDIVSARGVRNAFARLSGRSNLSTAQIAGLANAGDECALQVFSTLGETLGEALAPLLEELHIGTLLLAGQVARSFPLFQRPLCNALDGIAIQPAPDGAVFAGLATLFQDNEKE